MTAKAKGMPSLALDALKTLTGLSAVFIVLGYISVRAHFNLLGISAMGGLGTERYLSEALIVAMSLAVTLIAYLLPASLCILFVIYFLNSAGRLAFSIDLYEKSRSIFYRFRKHILFLYSVFSMLWIIYLFVEIGKYYDIAVGEINRNYDPNNSI